MRWTRQETRSESPGASSPTGPTDTEGLVAVPSVALRLEGLLVHHEDQRHVRAFGSAVRARREDLGLSQETLSFKAKVHRTYVSDVERGARNPTVKVIWKLAEALDTEPSTLFRIAEELVQRPS